MVNGPGTQDKSPATAYGAGGKAAPLASNLVGGDDDAYRAAQEHRRRMGGSGGYSRFVRLMKLLLPFLALGLVALIVVWPQLKGEDTFRIGFSSVRLSGTTEPGVDNARFMGTDDNRQPYSITADLARIDTSLDGLVRMEMPKADLTLDDGTWLVLTADNGRFFENRQRLELEGTVNLFHDTGYEISTQELNVDLRKSTALSETPVAGHGPFGELTSRGLQLLEKGNVIHFTGPAQLVLYPSQAKRGGDRDSGASK
ncbi:LPS export ABC transporter periplasmic protein LptC [Magnetovibrio sp. PR-2]|uniref:LPS export ABC transporter periplasmic protein LptC n=1 Tax=Magnetovibrio sp. PR-2 TaxID=3120356 RepID=UPI002FCDFC3B